jgi:hypothetical protein
MSKFAGVLGIGIANIEQGLIRGLDRSDDLLFEGAGEIRVVLQRGVLGPRPFLRNAVEDSAPDQHDRENADQGASMPPDQTRYPVQTGGQPVVQIRCLLIETRHTRVPLSANVTVRRWMARKSD